MEDQQGWNDSSSNLDRWPRGLASGGRVIERAAGARVLVVEDDAELRTMIAAQLRRDGFSVSELGRGDRVLSEMCSLTDGSWPYEGVDLLLLDLWLPGTEGLEVLHDLRDAGWSIPVLLMTGHADARALADAERWQVPLLRKPFSLGLLSDAAVATLHGAPVPTR